MERYLVMADGKVFYWEDTEDEARQSAYFLAFQSRLPTRTWVVDTQSGDTLVTYVREFHIIEGGS